jgi:predicted nucleotidyltransferase
MSDEINSIIDKIIQKFNPLKIVLFGSYVNNSQNRDSDLDLLVIMNSTLPKYKRSSNIKLFLSPYPIPLDILVFTPNEYQKYSQVKNHIVYQIKKTGKVLYDKQ